MQAAPTPVTGSVQVVGPQPVPTSINAQVATATVLGATTDGPGNPGSVNSRLARIVLQNNQIIELLARMNELLEILVEMDDA